MLGLSALACTTSSASPFHQQRLTRTAAKLTLAHASNVAPVHFVLAQTGTCLLPTTHFCWLSVNLSSACETLVSLRSKWTQFKETLIGDTDPSSMINDIIRTTVHRFLAALTAYQSVCLSASCIGALSTAVHAVELQPICNIMQWSPVSVRAAQYQHNRLWLPCSARAASSLTSASTLVSARTSTSGERNVSAFSCVLSLMSTSTLFDACQQLERDFERACGSSIRLEDVCRAFMEKSMTMRGGQAHVQRFWKMLLDKIVKGALPHN